MKYNKKKLKKNILKQKKQEGPHKIALVYIILCMHAPI
jgi:hypothetical protein